MHILVFKQFLCGICLDLRPFQQLEACSPSLALEFKCPWNWWHLPSGQVHHSQTVTWNWLSLQKVALHCSQVKWMNKISFRFLDGGILVISRLSKGTGCCPAHVRLHLAGVRAHISRWELWWLRCCSSPRNRSTSSQHRHISHCSFDSTEVTACKSPSWGSNRVPHQQNPRDPCVPWNSPPDSLEQLCSIPTAAIALLATGETPQKTNLKWKAMTTPSPMFPKTLLRTFQPGCKWTSPWMRRQDPSAAVTALQQGPGMAGPCGAGQEGQHRDQPSTFCSQNDTVQQVFRESKTYWQNPPGLWITHCRDSQHGPF